MGRNEITVTIDGIVKQAGVSPATISRVLDSPSYVKDKTKEKVLKVIEEVNHVSSAMARSLLKRETNTTGIIVPDITNSHSGEIIKGMSKVAEEVGLNTMLLNTNNDVENEIKALDEVKKHRLKGVIMTPEFGDTEFQNIFTDVMNSIDIPIVLISADLSYIDLNGVFVDDIKGGYGAANLLMNKGHNKIGTVTGIISSSLAVNRLNGYKKTLIKNSISIMDHYIKEGKFNLDKAYEMTKEFLDITNPPIVIISYSNKMILGVIKALFEKKEKIPRDIALVGFNKIDPIGTVGINLTYIKDSPIELGRSSTGLFLEVFESNEKNRIKRIKIPSRVTSNGPEDRVGQ